MADNISSSVLFHFTNCIDHLKSILRDGFYPHYCLEYTLDPRDLKAATNGMPPARAIPMVCFCDLPLSLISKHLKEYGCFGIGLSKSWGTQNGLAPVIYTHSKACTRLPLSRLAVEAISLPDAPFTQEIRYMAAHSKPFHGPAWRKKSVHKDIRFYDEREWRYVPKDAKPLFLSRSHYRNKATRKALHNKFKKNNSLRVAPDFIQYLIVPYDRKESNILELHAYVVRLYERRYSRRDAVLVSTTIMSDDCIREDV